MKKTCDFPKDDHGMTADKVFTFRKNSGANNRINSLFTRIDPMGFPVG